ncbi:DUF1971 domain-containing protein [Shewanella dokdonensis]|uniref:DUF1971 domain-containing protein n=1 Tax=Shewanella dokdonensis TaxID=712036 RepID=A0ABX8DF12_9GAMM|nr:DUF1971 domain-containing protein [Shewanella dokdonensis]QVK23324.1 DUF1971 domain-containing protein [Shewanella dokdonensis]
MPIDVEQENPMEQLLCYKTLPIWHKDTVPDAFKQQHNTQPGTWAQLNIRQGQLTFELLTESGEVSESHQFDVTRQPPMIAPQQWHRIASTSDDIECQLSFSVHLRSITSKNSTT